MSAAPSPDQVLTSLGDAFHASRDALHRLACYVVAPARLARDGDIGLTPAAGGFGTPKFADGSRIVVRADELLVEPGSRIALTTLRDAAAVAGVELTPHPNVGSDLPPYRPDEQLDVDAEASLTLGRWYEFGATVLDHLRHEAEATLSDPVLWPEHFDLAVVADLGDAGLVNVGFSAGDSFHGDPYLYVGPFDPAPASGSFWNAPFGALLAYAELARSRSGNAEHHALSFVLEGLNLLRAGR